MTKVTPPPFKAMPGLPGPRPPFYKRRYIINPRFQLTFVGWFVMVYAGAHGMLYFSLRGVLSRMSLEFLENNYAGELDSVEAEVFRAFVRQQQQTFTDLFLNVSLWLGLIMVIVGIVLSHRVAGPLYRMRLHLERMSKTGEPEELKFRTHDYFKELAQALNTFLKRIELKRRERTMEIFKPPG